jgi:predicted transcriptional regulator of viral defense system
MERQKQILRVFKGDKDLVLSKSEIIKQGKISYYHNTEKHVGDCLSRLVKNGGLTRVKKGYYKLGLGLKKQIIEDKDQLNLEL